MPTEVATPPPLPVGATGFSHVSRPLQSEGYKQAERRGYVHAVVRSLGASVSGEPAVEPRGAVVSFHRFDLRAPSLQKDLEDAAAISIAVHCSAPVAAFFDGTKRDLGLGATRFLDPPAGIDAVPARGPWRFWRKSWLDAPATEDLIAHLPEWERKEIAYWKPLTLGDLLFNRWD